MSPSLEYLERCSAETGYQVSALEKVVRLGEMAADIARHPLLGEALALKGGTALNLCFGPPGRLSVDLDYNYIAHIEREKMLAARHDKVIETRQGMKICLCFQKGQWMMSMSIPRYVKQDWPCMKSASLRLKG